MFATITGAILAATLITAPTAVPTSAPVDPVAVTGTASMLLGIPSGYDGAGIRVGVIDSGIAVEDGNGRYDTNPCFTDNGYASVEQTGQTAYTNNKVTVARVYGTGEPTELYPGGPSYGGNLDAQALSLHGSHVAGIIACNDGTTADYNGQTYPLRGIAPKASLGSYNVFPGIAIDGIGPNDTGIAQAVRDAQADGMDIINLSLSTGRTSAPETNTAITDGWKSGMITVVAAGNDGPSRATVGSPGNNINAITVGALETGWGNRAAIMVAEETFTGDVNGKINVTTEITDDVEVVEWTKSDADARKDAAKETIMDNPLNLSTGCAKADLAGTEGSVAILARGTCPFSQKIANAAKNGATAVIIVNFDESTLTPADTGGRKIPAMIVGLAAGKALVTADSSNVTLTPARVMSTGTGGTVAWFSSQGPTTSGLNKPDVLAPGGGILSAGAGDDCKDQRVCWAMESGTSMASPAVAGVVALVKSAHPEWTPAMVCSAVIHTAVQDPKIPVYVQGSGVVNATNAINAQLGLDVTGIAVKNGKVNVVNLINPSAADQVVTVKVSKAPGKPLNGDYTTTQTVTVPANGTAAVEVKASGTKVADNAMLVMTTASGYSIHAVISTVK